MWAGLLDSTKDKKILNGTDSRGGGGPTWILTSPRITVFGEAEHSVRRIYYLFDKSSMNSQRMWNTL